MMHFTSPVLAAAELQSTHLQVRNPEVLQVPENGLISPSKAPSLSEHVCHCGDITFLQWMEERRGERLTKCQTLGRWTVLWVLKSFE